MTYEDVTLIAILTSLEPVEELLDLLNVFGKRSGREGEEKNKKNKSSEDLSPPIERCDIIHWWWMPKAKEDDEDQEEEPSWIVEYSDKSHYNNSDQINDSASSSKKAINDVASIELSDRKKIECSYKKSDPSSKSDGVEHHLVFF